MNGFHMVRMSEAAFADIPGKVVPRTVRIKDPALGSAEAIEWIFSGYCEKLLYKNEGLQAVLERFAGKLDDPECQSCLTQGQRVLHSLGALDGEVKNGGLAQFFWNCPDLIFTVDEALKTVGEQPLAEAYDKALQSLLGNTQNWLELRQKGGSSNPDDFWEPFQASYDLLDLGWFDGAYFETYGASLVAKVVEYVRSHKGEFIEG